MSKTKNEAPKARPKRPVPDARLVKFGRRIRVARAAQGFSCAELGQRVGVSAQAINKIELGKMMCKSSTLMKLSDHLRVSIDWLFDQGEFEFITKRSRAALAGNNNGEK